MELENQRFDKRCGIAVEGEAEPADLTVEGDPGAGFTYVPTPVRLARCWLRALPDDASRFTFVDLGSGKGRVLALAAAHGFGTVVGVEFARELHDVAEANARAARVRGVEFEPLLADAALFAFPRSPLVVHFNNPFDETVMARVLENLADAYDAGCSPLVVVYQQLTKEDARHSTRNIALLDELPFLTGRSLEPRGWIERRVLAPYTVRIYASPEARNQ
jgi:predicted RNA methylase